MLVQVEYMCDTQLRTEAEGEQSDSHLLFLHCSYLTDSCSEAALRSPKILHTHASTYIAALLNIAHNCI